MVRHKLQTGGVACETVVADSKEGFETALAQAPFDLIFIDHNLPGYGGLRALELAQATHPDVPVILISGTVGEEEAVKCLHVGATDYLLKLRLERLVPAVERAIREAQERRTRKHAEAALRESESRKAAVLESVLDSIITMDADGTVLEFNSAAERTFGYTKAQAIGRTLADLIIPARFRDQHRAELARCLTTGTGPLVGTVIETMVLKSDGSEIPVELAITATRSGSAANFTAVLRDITARLHADATRARLAAIVDTSDDAIFSVALDDTILTWNAGAERLYGYAVDEIIGERYTLLVLSENVPVLQSIVAGAVSGHAGQPSETQHRRKDGSVVEVSLVASPMTDLTGRIANVSVIARDITGRKRGEAERQHLSDQLELQRARELDVAHALSLRMERLAQYDVLTNLPNRTLFDDRLTQAMTSAHRQRGRLAVLFVDLDRFKQVNDLLGHAIGDALLQSVTARLLEAVRASDTVSRHGGDEFVVLVSQIRHPADAGLVADKIMAGLAAPHEIAGHLLEVTASVGISVYPDDGEEAEALISAADAAMYSAKASGRHSTSEFFTASMNARRIARRSLEGGLRRAIREGQFVLHYQPKFALDTLRLTGAEALIRWQHPARGLVAPAEFIPVAEECGLIAPIGRWVLREACRQARAWSSDGLSPCRIAINVSAIEFRAKDFLENVKAVLDETGLAASCLELEVTESVLMGDTDGTRGALFALRNLGVYLAIDDFGTGYSSLSYLSRFPINCLKIDRSFVHGMMTEAHDASIITAVIAMGRSLNQTVLAEGVETVEQLAMLKRLSCAQGQGFYYSRPIPPEQFADLLRREPTAAG
jgi:diguanylate cyclase (GGDEF)-like protein/PAS domain S-box-containing protein